jgi:2-methylisocitrate lyase-like PEP mutase family enzyme
VTRDEQARRAAEFRALHRGGRIIVLPNVFDVASAKLAARHGPAAIGTTSAGIAWAAGYADGEQIPREQMLAVVERIVRAVDTAVTVDVESGYGDLEAVVETTAAVIGIGGIGINLEDADYASPANSLLAAAHAAERIAAARRVADGEEIDLTVNARTDVFLAAERADEEERTAVAIERGNLYLDAGADCVFVPGAIEVSTIAALTAGIPGPVNIYLSPGVPEISELDASAWRGRVSAPSPTRHASPSSTRSWARFSRTAATSHCWRGRGPTATSKRSSPSSDPPTRHARLRITWPSTAPLTLEDEAAGNGGEGEDESLRACWR